MDRRSFLATAAACSLGGLAGCSDTFAGLDGRSTPTPTDVGSLPLARQGRPPDICSADPVDVGIYAIIDPAFAPDWEAVDRTDLGDEAVIIGIEREGRARAYPLTLLWDHEIVNDVWPSDGAPLIATFCSLCRSGMVASSVVDGSRTVFGVSGQLWQPPELRSRSREADGDVFAVDRDDPTPDRVTNTANLVMIDEATGSYWSQLLARAICGPLGGETLGIVPSSTARWGDWRRRHPDTEVLLPTPHSGIQDPPDGDRPANQVGTHPTSPDPGTIG